MQTIYPWLQPLWRSWQVLSETHKISGAMLCSAPDGSGIEQLAEHFVHTLVCRHSSSEPCGVCHSCELAVSGNHPDIHWITPEKTGKAISVDQIRQCNQWALESSQLAGKRVIVINPAESMNQFASNALLKTLESPPQDCVFLLLSNNKNLLLPTIISRCQQWHLAMPDMAETYHWLQSQTDQPCNYIGIRLCNGAPLKSLAFFEKGQYQVFQSLEAGLETLLKSDSQHYGTVWQIIKDNPSYALSWLAIIMADIQKVHYGIIEKGMCERVQSLSALIPYNAAYNAMLSMNKLKDQLEHFPGLNAELLVTNWLIELQEDIQATTSFGSAF